MCGDACRVPAQQWPLYRITAAAATHTGTHTGTHTELHTQPHTRTHSVGADGHGTLSPPSQASAFFYPPPSPGSFDFLYFSFFFRPIAVVVVVVVVACHRTALSVSLPPGGVYQQFPNSTFEPSFSFDGGGGVSVPTRSAPPSVQIISHSNWIGFGSFAASIDVNRFIKGRNLIFTNSTELWVIFSTKFMFHLTGQRHIS